jgi:dienelactone hydrolase
VDRIGGAVRLRCGGALSAIVVAAGGLAACSPGHSTSATITVDPPVALADQAVHLRVSGLRPHERVTVSSRAADYQDALWHGEATMAADGDGVVDLDRSAPGSGSYGGVDGMGLFWSMRPPTGDADHASFYPRYPSLAGSFEVTLTVSAAGRPIASRTVRRQWISAEVTHRALDPGADRVAGELYLPPAGAPRRPGVLLIGGSEGGISGRYDAALLASHGYPALAVGYFGLPGLPGTLTDIPVEYFVSAARLLAAQPQARPDAVVVCGYSRGSEAALLLADAHPELIRGTLLYAPNDTVWPGLPQGDAWTSGGVPVPQGDIGVAHVRGSVLAVAGGDDRLWRSTAQARRIDQRLAEAPHPVSRQLLAYPEAGHAVGTFPYLPIGVYAQVKIGTSPVDLTLGGTRAADEAARRDSWPKVLAWLSTVSP